MLYYKQAFHYKGNLVMRLANAEDISAKELSRNSVLMEIARTDKQRPTYKIIIETNGVETGKELMYFRDDFNKNPTKYNYRMIIEETSAI